MIENADKNENRKPSSHSLLKKSYEINQFPEWAMLEFYLDHFCQDANSQARVEILGDSSGGHGENFPLITLSYGSEDPSAPTLGLFGGVHGLERIGSQVVLSLMNSFAENLAWDKNLKDSLKDIRIVFFPIINPWGVFHKNRSNANGVDLMRNAPIEADDQNATWLVGGHRFSRRLPWFRGNQGLEPESVALLNFCKKTFFQSRAVVTLDFHSGFGLQDRLWFPYAKSKKPFPNLAETYRLFEQFERTYPHHFYQIEPQSLNYTTHGDLWDYFYELKMLENSHPFIPLALEMGSWNWVKKNPIQLFSFLGPFNPIKIHRQKRILRRHLTLFEYLIRAVRSYENWSNLTPEQKKRFYQMGLQKWYFRNE